MRYSRQRRFNYIASGVTVVVGFVLCIVAAVAQVQWLGAIAGALMGAGGFGLLMTYRLHKWLQDLLSEERE